MDPADLERLADRELRALPAPRAPQSLLPRVMRAVETLAARPWYSRPWISWPVGWQAASALALVAVVGSLALWLPNVGAVLGTAAATLVAQDVPDTAQVTATTAGARIVWRTLLEPLLSYAFGIVALMVLACVVFGTALNYVVIERTAER